MGLPHKLNRIEYEPHLALRRVSSDFHSFFLRFSLSFFFAHPINPKGLVVFYIFQGLIHIFKDIFTKFQDKRHFFQIPGIFQVCANPVPCGRSRLLQRCGSVFACRSSVLGSIPGWPMGQVKCFRSMTRILTFMLLYY